MSIENLILDLDGTILFSEYRAGSIVIKGRRRDSYLALETVKMLHSIQKKYNIFLATGRSELSARDILGKMAGEGVSVCGIAAENGGVWVYKGGPAQYLTGGKWIDTTGKIALAMGSTAQRDFITCLALVKPVEEELAQASKLYNEAGFKFDILYDGNKVFFLESGTNKKKALITGIGDKEFYSSSGIGNDINDLNWLISINNPACPSCSKTEVKIAVTEKGGMVSPGRGHDGILQLLKYFHNRNL